MAKRSYSLMIAGDYAQVRGMRAAHRAIIGTGRTLKRAGRHQEFRVRSGKRSAMIAQHPTKGGYSVLLSGTKFEAPHSILKRASTLKSAAKMSLRHVSGKQARSRGSSMVHVRAHTAVTRKGTVKHIHSFTRKRRQTGSHPLVQRRRSYGR